MTTPPISKDKKGASWKTSPTKFFTRVVVVLLLIAAIAIAAIPGYLRGGTWMWSELPQIENTRQMRELLTTGIQFDNWQTVVQKQLRIGGNKWSAQAITKEKSSSPIIILLAPQTYYKDRPYVEWTDIKGLEKWKTDSHRQLKFTTGTPEAEVNARFFRAWNKQTFAIVQWYAFPNGGSFSTENWFWRDTLAQLRQKRVPWIAVCLKIPLNPLDDLESVETLATSLGKQVQDSLQKNVFYVSARQND